MVYDRQTGRLLEEELALLEAEVEDEPETAEGKMMKAANDNQAAWQEFHDANPGVYSLVEHFTKQVIDAGFKHYGMMSIPQRVRWHTSIETEGDTYRINNNHTPYYARHHADEPAVRQFLSHTQSRRCRMSAVADLFENDLDEILTPGMTLMEYNRFL